MRRGGEGRGPTVLERLRPSGEEGEGKGKGKKEPTIVWGEGKGQEKERGRGIGGRVGSGGLRRGLGELRLGEMGHETVIEPLHLPLHTGVSGPATCPALLLVPACYSIRYDTTGEFNVESKAECD